MKMKMEMKMKNLGEPAGLGGSLICPIRPIGPIHAQRPDMQSSLSLGFDLGTIFPAVYQVKRGQWLMGLLDWIFGSKQPAASKPEPAKSREGIHEDKTEKADWEEVSGVPQELAASEVLALYETAERPVFLDVREPAELKRNGWIPGSINIPMGQVEARLRELDPKKPVVVYCASGMRSMNAGALLLEKGFRDVSNLNGGISAWKGPRETT